MLKWWLQLQGGLLFKQLRTLHQSLRHEISRKSPLGHPVTAQWQAYFFQNENTCLPSEIRSENAHAQNKQCILPNRNGGMKYRGKVYYVNLHVNHYIQFEYRKRKDLYLEILSITEHCAMQTNNRFRPMFHFYNPWKRRKSNTLKHQKTISLDENKRVRWYQ